MFSMRFYSPNADGFLPNDLGMVDMSSYNFNTRRPRDEVTGVTYTNFDFLDGNGRWWYADHAAPNMRVFYNTLEYYSNPFPAPVNTPPLK